MRRHTHENDNYSLYNSKDHRRNKRHTETAKNRVNYLKVFKMEPFTETADDSDRIKSTKNVNLVQVKEIKSENVSTISVDIISTKYADCKLNTKSHRYSIFILIFFPQQPIRHSYMSIIQPRVS